LPKIEISTEIVAIKLLAQWVACSTKIAENLLILLSEKCLCNNNNYNLQQQRGNSVSSKPQTSCALEKRDRVRERGE